MTADVDPRSSLAQAYGECGRFSSDIRSACVPLIFHVRMHRALAELVRLKDGPRDDAYREAKDAAWQEARDVLSGMEGHQ